MKGQFGNGDLEPSAPSVKESYRKDDNYNKNKWVEPTTRMGEGDYANMPTDVIFKNFSKSHNYRSGILNAVDCGLEEQSGISENRI